MWEVRRKSGRAEMRVSGLGVCMSMKDILGRRRTMLAFLYLERNSRSRYLTALA